MEQKKSPRANLENKRKIFFELGLIFSILICLYGFEYLSEVDKVKDMGTVIEQPFEEIIIPITTFEQKLPPPPPPLVADLIKIVDDNSTEIDDNLDIFNSEATPDRGIYVPAQMDRKPEVDVDETSVFIAPEEMPEFPGGEAALMHFLSQNIKYPSIASDNGIKGKVIVNFIVNKDGSISEAKIMRGVDPSLDKEALRVVNSMPKWKPGKQSGKAVRVSYVVPINFVIQN